MRTVPAGPFRVNVRRDLSVDLELLYREDSATGCDALHFVERLCREANVRLSAAQRLKEVHIDQRPDTRPSGSETADPNPEGRSSGYFRRWCR